eukprot:TRINITY_DN10551_c0_g1_i2.p3 TRINITY_DN10551_c0_g1~~TRINITY_DN10551_c0_g1_i2.p3  ORF type:complete len:207 (-),score=12.48 TRINITY_DN10551_c0_g1_i2:165-785(-)
MFMRNIKKLASSEQWQLAKNWNKLLEPFVLCQQQEFSSNYGQWRQCLQQNCNQQSGSLNGWYQWQPNFQYATKASSSRSSRTKIAPTMGRKKLAPAIVHVYKTRNNTIMTLTDLEGQVKGWVSAGSLGMRNSRKSTPHAGELVGEAMAQKVTQFGYTQIIIHVKGIGFGKSQVVRSLAKGSYVILRIEDRTPTPHNGCRPKKKRRV